MLKRHIVRLSESEKNELHEVIKRLKGSSQKVRRAHILLKTDVTGPNWTDASIAEAFNCRIQTVENIQVFDPRYLSATGIGLQSTFGDIKANYEVKKIVTTMNSLVVFPKESNLYFTLYKEDLPENLRYTTSRIEIVQIPDDARIKYLMLGWNP